MKRLLVTGAGGPAGVNFIRSLKKAPERFYIVGGDANKYHLELPDLDKRYVTPKNTEKNYIEKINKIVEIERIEFVHPQPDSEVLTISENREKINAVIFLPKKETVRICQDKLESTRIWEKNGITVPKTAIIESEKDIEDASRALGFPFWIRATHGAGARGSTLVENLTTGVAWLKYWKSRDADWKFIAQEYLPGQNIAFQSVWKEGEIVCSQARERIEYIYPYLAPSGITGTPSVAKTIDDEEVNKVATDAVKVIDPDASGIFCVDLKRNKDNIPCPTEINAGRFFTTSYFFTAAGVNMPYVYVKLAYGEKIPLLKKYNCIGKDVYWIRHMDSGPVLLREGRWRSVRI